MPQNWGVAMQKCIRLCQTDCIRLSQMQKYWKYFGIWIYIQRIMSGLWHQFCFMWWKTPKKKAQCGVQLIALCWKLCKPYEHNPLNPMLLCLLSVFCWKADRLLKSQGCSNLRSNWTFRLLSQQMIMAIIISFQHMTSSLQYASTQFCPDNNSKAAALEYASTHIGTLTQQMMLTKPNR